MLEYQNMSLKEDLTAYKQKYIDLDGQYNI